MNEKPKPVAPVPGWVAIDNRTAGFIRAAGLDDVTVKMTPSNDRNGTPFAPAWAVVLATVEGVSDRMKLCALKKAARDPEARAVLVTLLGCIDPEDRRELVEQLGQEYAQTIFCVCGTKFDSAVNYRDHVEFTCPKRSNAIDKL